ncbi:MAG: hypothetical protein R3A47_05025 [Polyangiales bacterium]
MDAWLIPECATGTTCDTNTGLCVDGGNGGGGGGGGGGQTGTTSVLLGSTCIDSTDCGTGENAFCLDEVSFGYSGGYCIELGCESDEYCGIDGICLSLSSDGTVTGCMDACATAADCRAGYACADADGSVTTTDDRWCDAICLTDSECRTGEECVDGACTAPILE